MQRRELLLSGAGAGIAAVASRAFAQAAASTDKLIEWIDIPPPVPRAITECRQGDHAMGGFRFLDHSE